MVWGLDFECSTKKELIYVPNAQTTNILWIELFFWEFSGCHSRGGKVIYVCIWWILGLANGHIVRASAISNQHLPNMLGLWKTTIQNISFVQFVECKRARFERNSVGKIILITNSLVLNMMATYDIKAQAKPSDDFGELNFPVSR